MPRSHHVSYHSFWVGSFGCHKGARFAMHWGGVTPRFSPEDFRQRSACGVGTDWPISYEELDPFYQEAEELIGIGGEQGPAELDPRGKPFPMPALPLNYNHLQ